MADFNTLHARLGEIYSIIDGLDEQPFGNMGKALDKLSQKTYAAMRLAENLHRQSADLANKAAP